MIALLLAAALVPQVQSYHFRPSLRSVERPQPAEGYSIRIGADGKADVSAADAVGRFYAQKTLKQLGPVKGPLEIED